MYRQYEDIDKLEALLAEAEADYEAVLETEKGDTDDSMERIWSCQERIAELKDRLNFAWQDDEYDEDNADYSWWED